MNSSTEAKEAWVANIPKVMAYLIKKESSLIPSSPEGVYNLELAATGDVEKAQAAATEARKQILEAQVKNSPFPS